MDIINIGLKNIKEVYMSRGPLTDEIRSQEYYRLAFQCLELVHIKNGCNNNCAACPLNVHLYIDDPKDATLIKTSAAIDYKNAVILARKVRSDNRWDLIGSIFSLIFSLALIFVTIVWPVSCTVKKVKQWTAKDPIYRASQQIADTATPEITQRILAVGKKAWNPGDVTGDKLSDCIDSAVTFYEQYGPEAKILWVFDRSINWSHLFVAVPNGYGQWLYIEATRSGYELNFMLMQKCWNDGRFIKNLPYVRDVTYGYSDIKRNRFVWRW